MFDSQQYHLSDHRGRRIPYFSRLKLVVENPRKRDWGRIYYIKTEITARIIRIIPAFFFGKSSCVNRTYHSTNEGSLEITLTVPLNSNMNSEADL